MSGRRILVVEENAHRAEGHLPELFADLALSLVEAGCDVTVLTRFGWLHENPAQPAQSFRLVRPGRIAVAVTRLGLVLALVSPRPLGRRLRIHLGDLAFTLSARRLAHRLGAEVIVVSVRRQSYLMLSLAGAGRWIVYQFGGPRPIGLPRVQRMMVRVIRSAERSRRSNGGGMVIACNSEAIRRAWEDSGLGLESVRINFASSRQQRVIPDAREQLGLRPDWKIALVFGTEHEGKSPEVVFDTFAELERTGVLPEWHLLVVGKVAGRLERWRQGAGAGTERIHVLPGYQSEEIRDLVHAAVDVQVLSFAPGWDLDSGVLGDAIAWALPVLCSSGNQTAAEVERLGVGRLFERGNATSLRSALATLPETFGAEVWDAARAEWGFAANAARHLALLDSPGS
ncbi:MAG: hypothetical protein F2934_04850 [Actinobacteria bacterium]|uniref:Unannotated protein n=1 Tax=freshwater metagenome TaxID=449393 RepID=A0A6J7U6T2_9ZZZZ|nr:hypothetical protein [Actinomycetota bacterium]